MVNAHVIDKSENLGTKIDKLELDPECESFFLENTMILGEKYGKRRSIRSEDLFFFLEITMVFGGKYGKRRSIRSEDLFCLEITMDFGGKYGKRRSIRSEDLFLEIIMIFEEKLQSAPNFKYPSLIGFAQNFIFQNWVAKQKSLRIPALKDSGTYVYHDCDCNVTKALL